MRIRLLGRTVTTRTSVRYLIAVGRRRGGVTYSQYRVLEILAQAKRAKRPANLSRHFRSDAVHKIISRTRKRLHQINPKCPESVILSPSPGFYTCDCFCDIDAPQ